MKKAVISLSVIIFIFSMTLVSACMSDVECAGQGQNICQNKQISSYHCIDSVCQKSSEIGSVECCSSSDCASDQTCDTIHGYVCVGGSPYGPPINPLDNQQNIKNTENASNTLVYVIIIAGAIVVGFIILAIILSRKKKD